MDNEDPEEDWEDLHHRERAEGSLCARTRTRACQCAIESALCSCFWTTQAHEDVNPRASKKPIPGA